MLALASGAAPVHAGAAQLLHNADISQGSGVQPDSWRTEAWINDPAACAFHWTHPAAGGPGELEVDNLKPNDARWMQALALGPGWYYLSAEIRAENVGREHAGATISVMEDGIVSPDLKGTAAWTRTGFYLKVGRMGGDVEVGLRLGGFGSLNSGRAFFRNPSAISVAPPPPGASPVYDLESLRTAARTPPRGGPLSLAAVLVALALAAVWGWRAFAAEEAPRRPRAGPTPAPKKARRR